MPQHAMDRYLPILHHPSKPVTLIQGFQLASQPAVVDNAVQTNHHLPPPIQSTTAASRTPQHSSCPLNSSCPLPHFIHSRAADGKRYLRRRGRSSDLLVCSDATTPRMNEILPILTASKSLSSEPFSISPSASPPKAFQTPH